MLAIALLLPAAARAAAEPVGWTFGRDIQVRLDPNRGLTLGPPGYSPESPLLIMKPESPLAPLQRRRTGPVVFFRALYEGIEDGHRGLSQRADDDNDGRVDEDRADGIDNDRDGRVDEDFAAIGDRMLVMDVSDARGVQHVEIFHWAYSHLDETLFVKWQRSGRNAGPADALKPGALLLEIDEGAWRVFTPEPVASVAAGGSDDGHEAVIHIAPVHTADGWRWLGVAVLDNCAGRTIATTLDGGTFRLAHDGELNCALIITETLEGMACRFRTACTTFTGACPEPGAAAVPWLVPPLRDLRDYPDPPQAGIGTDPDGALLITLDFRKGWQWLPDPGKISADGRRLGPPDRVLWRPADGGATVEADWTSSSPETGRGILEYAQSYPGRTAITSGAVGGELLFYFGNATIPPLAGELEFETLCGQTLVLAPRILMVEENIVMASPATHAVLDEDPPALSQDLLDIYPNPFRDTVLLRYTIPRTVAEGFVWDKDRPPLVDSQSPIPYESGTPQVSLKVYSLAGHEVASLFEGPCNIGQYNTSWNGVSDSGRLMATGTYFCKLQIDKWSATRRLVLLR